MEKEFENAVKDSLTGLHTRDILKPLFKKLQKQGRFSLFIIDIDNFKLINDCNGHQRGDQVIVCMAKFLRENVEKGYVLRMGGDEFMIMMPGLDRRKSNSFAGKLFNNLSKKIFMGKPKLSLTFSGGIAFFPTDSDNLESLTSKADERLYAAKRNGRNQYCLKDIEKSEETQLSGKSTRLIGREKLFLSMREEIEKVLQGNNRLLVVRGEKGVGKTFLCNRFLDYAGIRGAYIARCDFVDLLPQNQVVKTTKFSSRISARHKFHTIFIDNFRDDTEGISVLETLFKSFGSPPILVLIAVKESGGNKVRMIETRIGRRIGMKVIKVSLLAKREFSVFVKGLLGGFKANGELIDFLYARTEGNPLFCEEFVKVLIFGGMVSKSNGEYEFNHNQYSDSLSDSLRDLLDEKAQGLRDEENAILSLASIVGRNFSISTLGKARNMSEESVLQLLKNPLEKNLIFDNGDGEFIFRLLFYEFFKGRLQSTERKLLHKKIANILSEQDGEDLRKQIFYHYNLAGEKSKTISVAMNICEEGIRSGYFPDAADYADYLVQNGQKGNRGYVNVLSIAADAYEVGGMFSKAIELHGRIINAYPKEKSKSTLKISRLYKRTGKYELALDLLLNLRLQRNVFTCNILNQIAETLMQMGKLDKALEYVKKSIELSKRYGTKEEEARGYYITAGIFWFRGEYELSENMIHKTLDILKREMKGAGFALAMNMLGIVRWSQGRLADAEKCISEAVLLFRREGKVEEENRAYTNLGIISESLGRWEEAKTYYRKAMKMAFSKNLTSLLCKNYDNIGTLLLKEGMYDESLKFFRKTVRLRSKLGERIELATTYHNIGACYMFRGNYRASTYFLLRAWKIFDEENVVGMKIDNLNTLFELCIFRRRFGEAKEYIKNLEILVDSNGTDFQKSQYYRVMAKYLRKKRKLDDSRRFARKSIEMLNSGEERYELGKSIFELGLTLFDEGNRKAARSELVKSRSIFSELGAKKAIERLDEIMNRMRRQKRETGKRSDGETEKRQQQSKVKSEKLNLNGRPETEDRRLKDPMTID